MSNNGDALLKDGAIFNAWIEIKGEHWQIWILPNTSVGEDRIYKGLESLATEIQNKKTVIIGDWFMEILWFEKWSNGDEKPLFWSG